MEIIFAILISLLPACDSEEARNCYFDASVQGNGKGTSFVDIGGRAYSSGAELAEGIRDGILNPLKLKIADSGVRTYNV